MPSIGPWFTWGVRIMGPKKPAQNPTAPTSTAPISALEINPFGAEPSFLQTYEPTPAAQSKEIMLRIQRFSMNGKSENGTQNMK
jgi:hypothetical protein